MAEATGHNEPRARSRSPRRLSTWPLEIPPRSRHHKALHLQMAVDLVGDCIEDIKRLHGCLEVMVDMQKALQIKALKILSEARDLAEESTMDATRAAAS